MGKTDMVKIEMREPENKNMEETLKGEKEQEKE